MGKVIIDISISLDGFVTASNQTPDEPMGPGGEKVHEWAFGSSDANRELMEKGLATSGAWIAGRKTYDTSVPWWKADGPSGPARMPLFVVTHEEPQAPPADSVYTFVTDGIESALDQATDAAKGKDVIVMGGANLCQQYLALGVVDEVSIHLAPVVFGSGTRLFENLGDQHIQLEVTDVVDTPETTHLRYRVVKA